MLTVYGRFSCNWLLL